MSRYYCTASSSLRITGIIGDVMDRAPRPYTASEISKITGLPIGAIKAFLVRNLARGTVSMRLITRRPGSSSGKPQREYWRGSGDISYTFGRGNMITEEQAQELAEGRRPMQWRETASTVWSIDETDTVAVRRGEQVICLGSAEDIATGSGRLTIKVRDGPRLDFSTKQKAQ